MIDTSADVLNIVKAFSISLLTIFVCWMIFYMGSVVKQLFKIVKEMGDVLSGVDNLIKKIHEKIDHSTSYLLLIGEAVKSILGIMKDYGFSKEEEKPKRKRRILKKK